MRYLIFSFFLIILFSCDQSQKTEVPNFDLPKISADKEWSEIVNSPKKVFYFLAPECPLCQNYAIAMRKLSSKYPKIEFIGIFPGKEYSEEEVKKYLIRFGLEFNSYFDPDFELTNSLGAEITPEAFLMDENGKVLYSGAIDNWAISLGQKRTVITERYLEEAIIATLSKEEIKTKKSQAVGCFIQ